MRGLHVDSGMPDHQERLGNLATAVAGALRWVGVVLWSVGVALVKPLRSDQDVDMRLSIPEAQTTTIDGDIGWGDRPPAVMECPECGGEIYQHRPRTEINCPDCWASFPHEEFPELELRHFNCSVCGTRMEHGRRHPEQFDVPEWATCNNCRYHWEFEHF